jgi:uncharacterized protein YndB with AHSA1/START domain
MTISVDRAAPVVVTTSIHVDAPIDTVWRLLADIGRWPTWNQAVKQVTLEGPVQSGLGFRWKSGPGWIRSTLLALESPTTIAWSGNTMGIKAIHTYRLTEAGGGVDVETEESWDGLPPKIFRGPLQKTLDKALRGGLTDLKAAAEAGS